MIAPLMLLVATILIVSVTYIIISTRHKEKMMIMEKGLDANFFDSTAYFLDVLKWGMLLLGNRHIQFVIKVWPRYHLFFWSYL